MCVFKWSSSFSFSSYCCCDRNHSQPRSNSCKEVWLNPPIYEQIKHTQSVYVLIMTFNVLQDHDDDDYINTADLNIYGNLWRNILLQRSICNHLKNDHIKLVFMSTVFLYLYQAKCIYFLNIYMFLFLIIWSILRKIKECFENTVPCIKWFCYSVYLWYQRSNCKSHLWYHHNKNKWGEEEEHKRKHNTKK